MAQVIKLKRSAVSGSVPLTSQLELGEVAINTYDGKMYIKKNDGADAIIEIGGFSSSATTPASPTAGQLWYDTANATLKYYTGAVWENIIGSDYQSNIITSTTVPTTAPDGSTALAAGDMYYNTSDKQLYVHDGTSWGLVNNNVQVDSDYVNSVVSKVQSNLDSDVGVLNTSISTIVGGNSIDSDYVANAISNVAGTLVDSDYVANAISGVQSNLDSDVGILTTSISSVLNSVTALDSDITLIQSSLDSDYVTITGTQTLTNKTLDAVVLNDGYTEGVFAVTGTTPALSPTNGSIQTWTLSGNSTPTAGTWAAGQSITLLVDDGFARTITWTSLSVVWKTNGGTAPTLNTSGDTVITLWKVGTTIYGARVGDA